MAYDKKRLQTFRELERVSKPFRYLMNTANPYEGTIFARYGRFYSTNRYLLTCCEWREFSRYGEDEWCKITRYVDDDGFLLLFPEFEEISIPDDVFEKFFFLESSPETFAFNPKLMRDALKIFEINKINPIWSANGTSFMFTGHNSDVSIKVLMMGCH